MKVFLSKEEFPNLEQLIRRCGYIPLYDKMKNRFSFVRRLSPDFYPRFHLYLDSINDQWILNLHLDQKKPIYQKITAHSGEYEGPLVEEELNRIKKIIYESKTI